MKRVLRDILILVLLAGIFFSMGRNAGFDQLPPKGAVEIIAGTVPERYQRRGPIRCEGSCDSPVGSLYTYNAFDQESGQYVTLRVSCDDVPDKHQCGYDVQ